jgi:hypothetical protein
LQKLRTSSELINILQIFLPIDLIESDLNVFYDYLQLSIIQINILLRQILGLKDVKNETKNNF